MKIWNHIRCLFVNFFKQLEKSNKEQFGNSTPDCCSLNRSQSDGKGNKRRE